MDEIRQRMKGTPNDGLRPTSDFTPQLRRAILLAHEAGLVESAAALRGRALATYATSSEWLGEVGEAIVDFLSRDEGRAPSEAIELLNDCLTKVTKVWPKYKR